MYSNFAQWDVGLPAMLIYEKEDGVEMPHVDDKASHESDNTDSDDEKSGDSDYS